MFGYPLLDYSPEQAASGHGYATRVYKLKDSQTRITRSVPKHGPDTYVPKYKRMWNLLARPITNKYASSIPIGEIIDKHNRNEENFNAVMHCFAKGKQVCFKQIKSDVRRAFEQHRHKPNINTQVEAKTKKPKRKPAASRSGQKSKTPKSRPKPAADAKLETSDGGSIAATRVFIGAGSKLNESDCEPANQDLRINTDRSSMPRATRKLSVRFDPTDEAGSATKHDAHGLGASKARAASPAKKKSSCIRHHLADATGIHADGK